jgi:hypothetical protein
MWSDHEEERFQLRNRRVRILRALFCGFVLLARQTGGGKASRGRGAADRAIGVATPATGDVIKK